MVAKLRPNRVRRTYLGGARIDAFTGFAPGESDGIPPSRGLVGLHNDRI